MIGIPSMVTGGRGSDSYVAAHIESPAIILVMGAYSPGVGDRGAYGGSSVEVVGETMMIGVHLLGGVGGLGSGMMGEIDSGTPPSSDLAILLNLSSGISQCGKGAMILGGRCLSGMPLYGFTGSEGAGELVGTVGFRASLLCSCLI